LLNIWFLLKDYYVSLHPDKKLMTANSLHITSRSSKTRMVVEREREREREREEPLNISRVARMY
jgi:hypothetical protein